MSQETSSLPEGSYFDEKLGMVITEAGKAKWRERLAVSRARRQEHAADNEALRARLRLGPAAQA